MVLPFSVSIFHIAGVIPEGSPSAGGFSGSSSSFDEVCEAVVVDVSGAEVSAGAVVVKAPSDESEGFEPEESSFSVHPLAISIRVAISIALSFFERFFIIRYFLS